MTTQTLLSRIDPERPVIEELRRIVSEDGAAEAVPPSAPQRPERRSTTGRF